MNNNTKFICLYILVLCLCAALNFASGMIHYILSFPLSKYVRSKYFDLNSSFSGETCTTLNGKPFPGTICKSSCMISASVGTSCSNGLKCCLA